jgi:Zn finger protein HypA/HybF involved in hydrogenase expression
MRDKDYQFNCEKCGFSWKSCEANKFASENSNFAEDRAEFIDYQNGYNCPKCRSNDVSGQQV